MTQTASRTTTNRTRRTRPSARCKRVGGFSLIELMIAMLIGLFILNGALQVVLNSRRNHSDLEAYSQLQETGRFAVDFLSRQLRSAGYFGCASPEEDGIVAGNLAALPGFLTDGGELWGLSGYDDSARTNFPAAFRDDSQAGTDAILVRYSDNREEYWVSNGAATGAGSLTLSRAPSIQAQDPVLLIAPDCQQALAFQAGNIADTTLNGVPASTQAPLAPYQRGSRLAKLTAEAFYIGNSTASPGNPALMREVLFVDGGALKTRSEELALGIADLQLSYALPADRGNYRRASDLTPEQLAEAVAVRIGITLRSLGAVHPAPTQSTAFGKNYEDRHLYQVVEATVQLRNRS